MSLKKALEKYSSRKDNIKTLEKNISKSYKQLDDLSEETKERNKDLKIVKNRERFLSKNVLELNDGSKDAKALKEYKAIIDSGKKLNINQSLEAITLFDKVRKGKTKEITSLNRDNKEILFDAIKSFGDTINEKIGNKIAIQKGIKPKNFLKVRAVRDLYNSIDVDSQDDVDLSKNYDLVFSKIIELLKQI